MRKKHLKALEKGLDILDSIPYANTDKKPKSDTPELPFIPAPSEQIAVKGGEVEDLREFKQTAFGRTTDSIYTLVSGQICPFCRYVAL